MRRLPAIAIATALVMAVVPHPSLAQAATGGDQARSPRYQAAFAFAQELRSRESVLSELNQTFVDGGVDQTLQNPDLAAVERRYPGSVHYLFDAVRPELERQLVAKLPVLWENLAGLFAAEMTDSEIAQAMAYYSSPAGRRFKAAMIKNYDHKSEIATVVKDLDAPSNPADIRKGIQNGVPGALRDMTAEDEKALIKFSATPAFGKIQMLNPRVLKIVAAWGDYKEPGSQEKISAIMAEAMKAFIAQHSGDRK